MPRFILPAIFLLAALALGARGPGAAPAGASRPHSLFLPAVRCTGCPGVPPEPTAQPSATPVDGDAREARMLSLVNAARVAAGCPAARVSAILMRATGDWSEHMRAYNIGEHTPSSWYTAPPYSYPSNAVLENIAGGSDDADYVFGGWMQSPTHRSNIEWCYPPDDPSYDPGRLYEIGVGYADGYWTLAIADRAP